jgi:hypothetical protein
LGEDFGMHAAQVVPTEVMMQREKCFNAATRDWEFFELDEQTSARELAAVAQNGSVKRFELVPTRRVALSFHTGSTRSGQSRRAVSTRIGRARSLSIH